MITLRHRDGTRVELSITRDDASQIAPALSKGWALVEVREIEITHEATPEMPPAKPVEREKPARKQSERKARAEKPADPDIAANLLRALSDGGQHAFSDLVEGERPTRAEVAAMDALVAAGRVAKDGRARGTKYALAVAPTNGAAA